MRLQSIIGSVFAILMSVGCAASTDDTPESVAPRDTEARTASVAQADTPVTSTFGVRAEVGQITWYSTNFRVPDSPRVTNGGPVGIGVTLAENNLFRVTAGATWNAPGHSNQWTVQVCQLGSTTTDYWENCGDSMPVAIGDDIGVYAYASGTPWAATVGINANGAYAVSRTFPYESLHQLENGLWLWDGWECDKLPASSFAMFKNQDLLVDGKPMAVPWDSFLDRQNFCNVDGKGFDDFAFVTWQSM